jgi:hypothetical protein
VLVEKVMGYRESVLAIELARLLGDFIKHRQSGAPAGEAAMLTLQAGLVRVPGLSLLPGWAECQCDGSNPR